MKCDTCSKFWSELGGWLTTPVTQDLDWLEIIGIAFVFAIAFWIVFDLHSVSKAALA